MPLPSLDTAASRIGDIGIDKYLLCVRFPSDNGCLWREHNRGDFCALN